MSGPSPKSVTCRAGAAERAAGDQTGTFRVFVISLTHSVERRRESSRILSRLGLDFAFIKGVNGQSLSPTDVERVYDTAASSSKFKRKLSTAEIGCYLSHYKAWAKIARLKVAGVVLEDDLMVADDLPRLLIALAASVSGNELVKLHGGNRYARAETPVLGTRYILRSPMIAPGMTTGYFVTPQAAQKLVRSALPFARPVDVDIKHWWEPGIDIYTTKPDAVWVRESSSDDSAISTGRMLAKGRSPGRRFFRNLRYQFGFLTSLCHARLERACALRTDGTKT